MNECYDYQASPRLDMIFNTYIKIIISFLFFIYFYNYNYQNNGILNKRKEKGWAYQ